MSIRTFTTAWACEGTSALSPRPHLSMVEGGLAARRPAQGPSASPARAREGALSRGQETLFLAVGALVIAVLCLASAASDARARDDARSSLSALPAETVTVREGDSLWAIASERSLGDGGTAEVVSWIQEANGLEGGLIVPGQSLVVPAVP